jgi:hypothetical protein
VNEEKKVGKCSLESAPKLKNIGSRLDARFNKQINLRCKGQYFPMIMNVHRNRFRNRYNIQDYISLQECKKIPSTVSAHLSKPLYVKTPLNNFANSTSKADSPGEHHHHACKH